MTLPGFASSGSTCSVVRESPIQRRRLSGHADRLEFVTYIVDKIHLRLTFSVSHSEALSGLLNLGRAP
jgi:hypothetical protein